MPLIKPFEEKDLKPTDPLSLLPKKLRTLIMVYKAGVESGLIRPKESADEEATQPDMQAGSGDGLHPPG